MNEDVEKLIEICNKLNYKIFEYRDSNVLTKMPQARIKDTESDEMFFARYEDDNWKLF